MTWWRPAPGLHRHRHLNPMFPISAYNYKGHVVPASCRWTWLAPDGVFRSLRGGALWLVVPRTASGRWVFERRRIRHTTRLVVERLSITQHLSVFPFSFNDCNYHTSIITTPLTSLYHVWSFILQICHSTDFCYLMYFLAEVHAGKPYKILQWIR